MEYCLVFIQRCFGLTQGSAYHVAKEQLIPKVELDATKLGDEVVIVKNGQRICGSGAALANTPILQNKAYFEAKVQQTGIWGVGLATDKLNLNCVPLGHDSESWVLRHDGTIVHNNQVLFESTVMPKEGDVVSVTYDHVELKFFLNDIDVNCSVTGTKGNLFPVFYVDDGAILDSFFSSFTYKPPDGFDRILIEKSLL